MKVYMRDETLKTRERTDIYDEESRRMICAQTLAGLDVYTVYML